MSGARVDEFYGDAEPPLPIGVLTADDADTLDRSEADTVVATGSDVEA